MESNLLINHPASLDTVTALKRDSDACISTSAHQSASACGSTEALCTIYQYTKQCRTVCGFDLPETRTMCTSVDQAVHICKLDWMLGRKPESNYSRDDIRSIQIPRAFQPPVHCAHLFGFLALDAIASLREHTIIFHLYFRSQIPTVAHRCAMELIFGSAARFSAPGWIFPHPSETGGAKAFYVPLEVN